MKSLIPWFCLAATASLQVSFAAEAGINDYRQGDYFTAANDLKSSHDTDPIVNYYLARMNLYGYGQLKNNNLGLTYLKKAGEKGFLPAQNTLARYELLYEKNPEQALYWFKKAADADDLQAQMYCAAAYLFGYGTKENSGQARKYYIAAAKNGNSVAQYTLAEHFLDSRYSQNHKLGVIWLEKAVEQKNPQAQLKLGQLYENGQYVKQDLSQAKTFIQQAIDQGSIPAVYEMGVIAEKEKNYTSARDWYTKAAEKDNISAQLALAALYLQEDGPLYDGHKGFLWTLKAAQKNSKDAKLQLAKLYREGKAIPKDDILAEAWEKEAKKHTKKSDEQAKTEVLAWLTQNKAASFPAAGYQLGGIFNAWYNPRALRQNIYNQPPKMETITRATLYKPQFVMSTPNDIAFSEYYDALANALAKLQHDPIQLPEFSKEKLKALVSGSSAVENSPTAASKMQQTEQNEEIEALDFLSANQLQNNKSFFDQVTNAAILGNANAQFMLGEMYHYGIGVEKNIPEAIKYYQLASDQRDLKSEYNLALIYISEDSDQFDVNKAIDYFRDSAFKGSVKAQYALARIKEQGYKNKAGEEVVKPDHNESLAMYYLAASNDYAPAQYRLAEILVRDKESDMSVAAKAKRNALIKSLYQDAAQSGMEQAVLPLAFFNAMEPDKAKQAEAFVVAKEQAEKGNDEAALLLALLYDRGIGVEADPHQAIQWYQKASVNPVSAFILGTYYSQGKGLDKDIGKGKALLQQSADAGFSYANLNLAVLKQQQKEPFLLELDTARSLGNSTAGLLLADYYLSDKSDANNMQQARDIYYDFASKGDKNAQLKLGFMLEEGLGGPVALQEAQQWYTKSADQGQPIAQYLLARMYQLGKINNKPDYLEAKQWYSKAKSNYPAAGVNLGFIYDTVEDNYGQASLAYQSAAQQNDPVALFNLGLIYEYGKGRSVDFNKARDLYSQALSKSDLPQAMVQLAGLYFNGLVGSRDEQEALKWYEKAASLGDSEAYYHLGLMSETGVAIAQDLKKAIDFYQKSADKGNDKAKFALARIYQYGLGVPQQLDKAMQLYQSLAEAGNSFAQYQLATLYFEASGDQKQLEKGKKMLQKAEQNGSEQAKKMLQWLDAQTHEQFSYIEPARLNHPLMTSNLPVEIMYLDALNEWNRGDEEISRLMLDKIRVEFPHFAPAKRAYEQLLQLSGPKFISSLRQDGHAV